MVKQKLHCKNAALIETACQAYKKPLIPGIRASQTPSDGWLPFVTLLTLKEIYTLTFSTCCRLSQWSPFQAFKLAEIRLTYVILPCYGKQKLCGCTQLTMTALFAAREPLWRPAIQSQSRDLCFSLESMPVSMGLGQNIDKVISRCLLSRCNYRVKMSIF